MPIVKLDHVNIRTTQLDIMINWYTNVLGLRRGDRPSSSSEGAWLYAGESAVVHLVQISDQNSVGSEASLKLEHFSLSATDAAAFEAKLNASNQTFKRVEVSAIKLALYNVWDPDGNHIHVDFVVD